MSRIQGDHVARISSIVVGPRIKKLNRAKVARYRQALRQGDTLPAIAVIKHRRGRYQIFDGYHRFHAHRLEGRKTIAGVADSLMRISTAMPRVIVVLALMLTTTAQAQQRTIYGSDGRVQGRVTTDSQGSTVIYGADGRVQGRTSTSSDGTVTIYDASGHKTGTVTTQPKREKP